MLDVLAAFLVTRVTLVVVAALAVSALPISSAIPLEWLRPGLNPIFESFSRWDSLHYLDIAWGGYRASDPSSPAFFPLFPMIVRLVGRDHPLRRPARACTRWRSWSPTWPCSWRPWSWSSWPASTSTTRPRPAPAGTCWSSRPASSSRRRTASRCSWRCRWAPSWPVDGRRWWQAGILGGLAALTRPFGVLIILPLAIEAWQQRAERPLWRSGLAMLPIPLALLGYMAYLGFQFGDPMAFLNAQSDWDRSLMAPWDTIGRFLDGPFELNSGPHSLVDFAFMLLAVVLAVAVLEGAAAELRGVHHGARAVPAADRVARVVPAIRAHLLPDVPGAWPSRVAVRRSTGRSSSRAWASARCSWRCTHAGTGWPEPSGRAAAPSRACPPGAQPRTLVTTSVMTRRASAPS